MTNDEIEQQFIEDTKEHTMDIINDDDINRRIIFSRKGSSAYQYILHTWPGYLMITGDMGTYVFRRIDDMFNFFSTGSPNYKINPGYWSEKLEAINSHCGSDASIKEYKSELFERLIKDRFNEWVEDEEISKEEKVEVWEDIEEQILYNMEDEQIAYHSAYNYSFDGTLNFYEENFSQCREYNFHFIWILYAIVDGIEQYKEYKDANT